MLKFCLQHFLFVPPMQVLEGEIDLISRLQVTGVTDFVFADIQLCLT